MTKPYSLVWQELSPGSAIGTRFWAPDAAGGMPFFVDGENLEKLKSKQSVPLDELMLLKGLLFSWNEPPPMIEPLDEGVRRRLLEILRQGYRCDSLEAMVMGIAARAREENGSRASCHMLRGGRSILPESAKIKSDFALDLGMLLGSGTITSPDELLRELVETCDAIQEEEVLDGAFEILLYLKLAALGALGQRQEMESHYAGQVAGRLSNPVFREKADELMAADAIDIVDAFGVMRGVA